MQTINTISYVTRCWISPNFVIERTINVKRESKPFSSLLINKTLEYKDSSWLEKALEYGLREEAKPFWQDIVEAAKTTSAPKALIRTVANQALKHGECPTLDTLAQFGAPLFSHDPRKLGMICAVFQPLLEPLIANPNLAGLKAQNNEVVEIDFD